MNNIHHTPTSLCPSCGHPLDAASGIDDNAAPSPGDVTICAKCGELLAFTDDLTVVPATAERLDLLDPEQVIKMHSMQTFIRQKAATKPKENPAATNTIKLDDEQTIAWIRAYQAERERTSEALKAYQAEVEANIEKMRAASNETHKAFWKRMEQVAPATIDGDWRLDVDYLDQGLVFLTRKEEEKADPRDKLPAPLRAMLDALEGVGGKVGVAKISLKRDDDKDE
jgi:hypothetical protein